MDEEETEEAEDIEVQMETSAVYSCFNLYVCVNEKGVYALFNIQGNPSFSLACTKSLVLLKKICILILFPLYIS